MCHEKRRFFEKDLCNFVGKMNKSIFNEISSLILYNKKTATWKSCFHEKIRSCYFHRYLAPPPKKKYIYI